MILNIISKKYCKKDACGWLSIQIGDAFIDPWLTKARSYSNNPNMKGDYSIYHKVHETII